MVLVGKKCTGIYKPRSTPARPTRPKVVPTQAGGGVTRGQTKKVVVTPKPAVKPTPVVPVVGPGAAKKVTDKVSTDVLYLSLLYKHQIWPKN